MMFASRKTFVGIDPTAGQRPIAYAALDEDLRLLALGKGDMNEVLAFVNGLSQAVVAISAPQRPNQGVMDRPEVREHLSPQPRPGRWRGFRLAEYQLRQHHISSPRTPSSDKDCPVWVQMGFALYRRLEGLGFKAYPAEAELQYIEVYPYASFCVLLERAPFPKTSLEGRIQRQLILYEEGLRIPDPLHIFDEITRHNLLQGRLPLDQLYSTAELDALVGAYSARLAASNPEGITILGDPQEGQLVLPVAELKRTY
jgi:hypothetical protein